MNISNVLLKETTPFKEGDIVVIVDGLREKDKLLIGRYYKVQLVKPPSSGVKCNNKCGEMCIKSDKKTLYFNRKCT